MFSLFAFSPPNSPPLSPIPESLEYPIFVDRLFCWEELEESLRSYVARAKENWEDLPPCATELIAEMQKWLDHPPDSAKQDPRRSLREWKEKVDALGDVDLQKISIVEL